MKLIYAGAPAFSLPAFERILAEGHEVLAVLTQPDRPFGRKGILTPTPLKALALQRGVRALDYPKVREHAEELASLGADLMVTCAYGQLLTQQVLDAFPAGVYNIHASLLPRWRGASPIQHAILAGDAETGITVMKTDIGLDTGDVLLTRTVPLDGTETADSLSATLAKEGAEAIAAALPLIAAGAPALTPQRGEATLCKKIGKEQCAVDFSRPAAELSRLVRAMNPQPLAFSSLRGAAVNFYYALPEGGEAEGACGQVVRADKAGIFIKAGEGILRVTELQLAGGKRLRAADLVNGRKVCVGDVFGAQR